VHLLTNPRPDVLTALCSFALEHTEAVLAAGRVRAYVRTYIQRAAVCCLLSAVCCSQTCKEECSHALRLRASSAR
jgi:hypothetical protein